VGGVTPTTEWQTITMQVVGGQGAGGQLNRLTFNERLETAGSA
jgi:hypothetical protein